MQNVFQGAGLTISRHRPWLAPQRLILHRGGCKGLSISMGLDQAGGGVTGHCRWRVTTCPISAKNTSRRLSFGGETESR